MKKQDLRSIRTKKAIQNSFVSLLQEMPFNKVTVSGIAKRAFIDRQTFYLHYTDKYDLLEKMCDQVENNFQTIFAERMKDGYALQNIEEILSKHYSYLDSHSQEILSLLKIDTGDICLEKKLKKSFIIKYQEENDDHLTPLQADLMSTLYLQAVIVFLKEKKSLNSQELKDLLNKLQHFLY